jgi:hypothetical protein
MVRAMFPRVAVAAMVWHKAASRGAQHVGAALVCLAWACVGLGCGSAEADGTPAEALSRFLEAMDRSVINESALKDAYALLDEQAQRELISRANRAGFLTGRKFEPWDMIAQGRFRLRFAPAEHAGMHTTVSGDTAIVQVKSENTRSQAAVPLVREAGRWRVKLVLPTLAHTATADGAGR